MVYNAIGQSAQPILSYNFGAGNGARVRKAFRLALLTAVAAGLGFFGLTALFSRWIVAMFIDSSCPACAIAVRGLPLFASGFVFFAVNIVSIGYFQSVERARPAMLVTVLRGFVFMVACFFGLPLLLGVEGIWLAVPLAEVLTPNIPEAEILSVMTISVAAGMGAAAQAFSEKYGCAVLGKGGH